MTKRLAGTIKINGVSYRLLKEKDKLTYERKSIPKTNLTAQTRRAMAGQSNMIEYAYGIENGFGDAVVGTKDGRYHYGANMYFEHEGEIVVLQGHQYTTESGVEVSNPPVGVFEINVSDVVTTYIVQDCKVAYVSTASGAAVSLVTSKTFEAGCVPSDAISFNNVGYVAMGTTYPVLDIVSCASSGGPNKVVATTAQTHYLTTGDIVRIKGSTVTAYNGLWKVTATPSSTSFTLGNLTYSATATAKAHKLSNRYLRRFTSNSTWSADANSYKTVTAVSSGTGGLARFACTSHGYAIGDIVQLIDFNVAAYNSMSTANVSTLYTVSRGVEADANTFEVTGINYSSTATGYVCKTDSDVLADKLVVVGDLIVRAYLDPTDGWVTSRVDAVASNPLLDANWTAGIGTVGVGDVSSKITELVAIGEGEVVCKEEGAFIYNRNKGAYLNAIPELEDHKHPDNGKGATEHKGWVYIPTVIGVLRYKNGQTQNVTPGRGGQQSFETPIGPIGALVGDAERLYAITRPFQVNQPKNVSNVQTAIYVDYNNAGTAPGSPNYNLDPQVDLNGLTTSGYIYFGSSQPWHRMHVEIDPQLNSLYYSLSALAISTAEYWNGTSWTTRSGWIDYTRVRDSSGKYPSSFGRTGDIVFTSEIPNDWAESGDTPSAGALLTVLGGSPVEFYWTRFKMSAAISNSLIITRIIAGIHISQMSITPAYSSKELTVDHGGMQFVLSMTEEQGKGPIWRTMWGWKQPDVFTTNASTAATYITGGAQPTGACAIIQPNSLRCKNGARFLLAGLYHNSMVMALGHAPDPTEDGPYLQQRGGTGREYWIVFPDTDCGLPYVTKTLQEINFDTDGQFTNTNIQAFYRVDGGAWTSAGTAATLPILLTPGAEPQGIMFGLAIHIGIATNKTVNLPRITSLPSLRFQPHPEMAELITLTVELEPEETLPGQADRRSAKTSYSALRTLQVHNTSVPYVDVDESTDYVHIMQIVKHVVHNSDQQPRVVADLTLGVVPT